ncbi:hypothetical protein BSKO_13243 [Bryopsis sp. KO-2023]|nr:hypothetical protein BSKO_13243 [Bryopsis sp. KO-2023]
MESQSPFLLALKTVALEADPEQAFVSLRTLEEASRVIHGYEGQELDVACFLVLLGRKANAEMFEVLRKLLAVVATRIENVDGGMGKALALDLESFVRNVPRLMASGEGFQWPHTVNIFVRLEGNMSVLHESGDPNRMLSAVPGFPNVLLIDPSEALGMAAAAATLLSLYCRSDSCSIYGGTVESMAGLSSRCDWSPCGPALVEAIACALEGNLSYSSPEELLWRAAWRAALTSVHTMHTGHVQPRAWEKSLCKVLDKCFTSGLIDVNRMDSDVIAGALSRVPMETEFWKSLFDLFVRFVGAAEDNEGRVNVLLEYASPLGDVGRRLHALGMLGELCGRFGELVVTDAQDLASMVAGWVKTSGEGFSNDELVALTKIAVGTCIHVLLGTVSLDKEELSKDLGVLAGNVAQLRLTNFGGIVFPLLVLVDGLHGTTNWSSFAMLVDAIMGGADPKLLCLAPFIFRLTGASSTDCVAALSNLEVNYRGGEGVALANSLGYIATAFCASASEDRGFFLEGLASACHYVSVEGQQASERHYPVSGQLPLMLSASKSICEKLLSVEDDNLTEALFASMAPILELITEEGLQESKGVLEALFRGIRRMQWECIEPFIQAFLRQFVLEEWSGCKGVDAKLKLVKRICSSRMDREEVVRFLQSFYEENRTCREVFKAVVGSLITILRTNEAILAEVALEDIAACEDKSLNDIIWENEGQNFQAIFTLYPDAMDKVSELIGCEKSELPKCFVRNALDLIWEENADEEGQSVLAQLSHRIPEVEWRPLFMRKFQESLVAALWRVEEGVWKKCLRIGQEMSHMGQKEWQQFLTSKFNGMSALVVRCAGLECKGISLEQDAKDCLARLRALSKICKTGKRSVNDFMGDPFLVNQILMPINARLSSEDAPERRKRAWGSLKVLLRLFGEAGNLISYIPQCLALVRVGMLKENEGKEQEETETEAREDGTYKGLEVLEFLMDSAVLRVVGGNLNILQEIVVALAPALATKNEAHRAACRLLKQLISTSSPSTVQRLAALTFGTLHINHTRPDRECPILEEIYGDLHASKFFVASGDSCPLFEELCACLTSGCEFVLMEGVKSMQEFLEENRFWVRKLACGEMGSRGLKKAKEAVGILARCLYKTGRSTEGRHTNATCARCLGRIGIVNPKLGHPVTFTTLEIPENEDTAIHILAKNLERILFSGAIHSVSMASQALYGLCQKKIIDPQEAKRLAPWLAPPSLRSSDVLLERVTAETLTSVGDLSFRRWLFLWLVFLHDKAWGRLPPTNIKVVVAAMEHDVPSMISFFPFLMYHAILEVSSADMDVMVEGLLVVLEEANNKLGCQRFDTQKCQLVFLLLDSLHGFLPESTAERNKNGIGKLFARFDGRLLATAAFNCGAYTRALKYMEEHLMKALGAETNPFPEHRSAFKGEEVTFLMQIYSQLGEPDGLSGLAHLRSDYWHVLALAEENREWDTAIREWYLGMQEREDMDQGAESMSQGAVEPTISNMTSKDQMMRGWLRCLLKAGRFQDIKHNFVTGSENQCAPWALEQMTGLECEALWKMGEWQDLSKCLDRLDEKKASGSVTMLLPSPQEEFNLRIGRLLLMLQDRQSDLTDRFAVETHETLVDVLRHLPARAAESYTQACPLRGETGDDTLRQFLKWGRNSHFLDALPESRELRVHFRRQLSTIIQDEKGHHRCSIEVIKMAGQAGIDVNTMLWLGDTPNSLLAYSKALKKVGKELDTYFLKDEMKRIDQGVLTVGRRYQAKLSLELARRAEGFGERPQETIALLEKAKASDENWVKPCLEHARFLDKLYELECSKKMGVESDDAAVVSNDAAKLLPKVLESYGKAASLSDKHARDCISRILTLYFQFGDEVSTDPGLKHVENRIHGVMERIRARIPLWIWYISLPNLMARICHSHNIVQAWVVDTMSSVANAFPHQTLWAIAGDVNSTSNERRNAAKSVLQRMGPGDLSKSQAFTSAFLALTQQLFDLCFAPTRKKIVLIDAAKKFPGFYSMVHNLTHDIILPCERFMRGCFAGTDWTDPRVSPGKGIPTIIGMKKEVRVMTSLVQPKKITFLGSDGLEYPFLAKPKDDLRKDCRLMEFCWVLNDHLRRDSDVRKRDLKMRTYTVVPLKEKGGILEWVDGIATFRELCSGLYRADGLSTSSEETIKLRKSHPEDWYKITMKKYKPRFHRWFLQVARRPDEWLEMRLAFTRSAAVWSMVGHILGLGDRHPENMNVDRSTGTITHVDFGCLFDDGTRLPVPEVTPFRLTPNMVNAFGVTSVEGVFMKSAVIVLKVVRESRSLLITIMEAMLHDPVFQWGKNKRSAKEILATVEGRMEGRLLGIKGVQGVSGTVREQCVFLVREATSVGNLERMFVGWMPWL